MARFEAEQKRKRFQNSIDHPSTKTTTQHSDNSQDCKGNLSSTKIKPDSESGKEAEGEKSKYEPVQPFRSLKGDRFRNFTYDAPAKSKSSLSRGAGVNAQYALHVWDSQEDSHHPSLQDSIQPRGSQSSSFLHHFPLSTLFFTKPPTIGPGSIE
ncbi:putative sucrose transporter [Erysiphe necator]|uniref:Putative sucrose transporter n=1 Tax=Uncinula necator TaxID=52586 RepID=A0A0B1P6E5_UNCNE|nr:putative sucrose transporter [Erysiphe necator]